MKKCIFIIIVLLSSCSCYAFERPAVTIAVDEGNPPFMFKNGARAHGLYPDIVRAVFQQMSIQVVVTPIPWKRALVNADNGFSGIAGIYKTPDRQKKYDYSDALFQEDIVFFTHKKNENKYKNLTDLEKKKIGVIRGWSYGEKFDVYRKNNFFSVEEVDNDAQNFNMLAHHRIDCLIAIRESGRMQLSQRGDTGKIVQIPDCITTNETYLIFPKKMQQKALISHFNNTLDMMKKNGKYQQIVQNSLSKQIE